MTQGGMQETASGSSHADPRAWLQRHGDALYAYALTRTADPAAAEDLVQDTLLAAWEARSRFRGDSSERTWLTGILKHKLIDQYRRTAREREESGADPVVGATFSERGLWKLAPRSWKSAPDAACEAAEFWEVLRQCLEELPPRLVFLFSERELSDVDGADLCKQLDLTPTNFWTLLHRARIRLRGCLEANWFAN
ncbi:MAG: RNA polymerase sigma factor [Planctomycetota bacterium]